ncbi:MAG: DUF5050 domain-containing protein [Maledivibacter sp.]|jgi:hypothetical protein|nr:DUF5050 domain-containing protein [Maledivibacter sp.]
MKKIFWITILISLVLSTIAFAENDIKIYIDGEKIEFDLESGAPFIDENSRVQVPFRIVMEKFGSEVSWDGEKKEATAKKDNVIVKVPIEQPYIYKNDEKIDSDTVAIIKNGRTYLPIRVVLEAFGAEIVWNNNNKAVTIFRNESVKQEKRGNLIGNYGQVVKYDNYVIYSNFVKDIPLTRENLADGTKKILVNIVNEDFSNLNVVDGWLYYLIGDYFGEQKLYRIDIDGDNKKLLMKGKIRDLQVVDNNIYYKTEENEIFRMDINGKNPKKLLNSEHWFNMIVTDGWIYILEHHEKSSLRKLYRINIDGTEMQTIKEAEDISKFSIDGKFIYFTNSDEHSIYKMKKDGRDVTEILNDITAGVFWFNVYDNWIYYRHKNGGRIYKVRTNGTDSMLLVDEVTNYCFDIIDDWIYYDLYDGCTLYRVKNDNSINQQIRACYNDVKEYTNEEIISMIDSSNNEESKDIEEIKNEEYTKEQIDYFIDIALKVEFNPNDHPDGMVKKWIKNPKIKVFGSPNKEDIETLNQVINEINGLNNSIEISFDDTYYNMEIFFIVYDNLKLP